MSSGQTNAWWHSPARWPLAGLVLLAVVNVVHDQSFQFFRVTMMDGHFYGSPIDILHHGSLCMLLALGMTLVIATGGIDLSVGSVMAITGAVAAVMLRSGASLPVALAGALGAGWLCGMANGVLVAWARVQPIVATLVLMVAGRGIAQLISNDDVVLITNTKFAFLGNGFVMKLPFAAVLVVALYVVAWWGLRKTAAGLFLEAAGDNETASRFAGLATARVKCTAYAICGLCAGLAGLLEVSNISAADPFRTGEGRELDAIFAVVVGGTALTGGRFTLVGSLAGALLLQTLTTTMYNLGVPPAIAPVPKALLILTVCLLQSEKTRRWLGGLMRRKAAA
ncbi:MAG: ABC transporter permease [Opitutales bacterium]|jgi:simple sugar transport system permease protein